MAVRMTQNEMILDHLKMFGSITPMKAIEEYGCLRLAARISDLKDKGYYIRTDHISRKNRFGKTVTFAKYVYIPQEEEE